MKKALNIVRAVLVWTLVAVAVFMMIFTVVSVATFNSTERNLFGFKFFVVQTDSMSKSEEPNENVTTSIFFNAGDIVVVRDVEMSKRAELQPDEVITFISRNNASFGETVTHAIRRKAVESDGTRGFITYGANTGADDESVVEYGDIVGKYVGHIPMLGRFFLFLKTTPGYIVCIFVPIVLLILYNGTNVIRLFRKYKKEQSAKLEEERRQIEEEKKANEETMRKLAELQAQLLANQQSFTPPPQTPPSAPVQPETPVQPEAPAQNSAEDTAASIDAMKLELQRLQAQLAAQQTNVTPADPSENKSAE